MALGDTKKQFEDWFAKHCTPDQREHKQLAFFAYMAGIQHERDWQIDFWLGQRAPKQRRSWWQCLTKSRGGDE